MSKWYKFDVNKGFHKKLPPVYKPVLLKIQGRTPPDMMIVGHLKYSAGDKSSPYFVTPGYAGGSVIAWCDCLDIPQEDD